MVDALFRDFSHVTDSAKNETRGCQDVHGEQHSLEHGVSSGISVTMTTSHLRDSIRGLRRDDARLVLRRLSGEGKRIYSCGFDRITTSTTGYYFTLTFNASGVLASVDELEPAWLPRSRLTRCKRR